MGWNVTGGRLQDGSGVGRLGPGGRVEASGVCMYIHDRFLELELGTVR